MTQGKGTRSKCAHLVRGLNCVVVSSAETKHGQPGVNLGSTWGQAEVKLRSSWEQAGFKLGSSWGQAGVNLGSTRCRLGVNLHRLTSSASGELRFSAMKSHARLSAASASAALDDSRAPSAAMASASGAPAPYGHSLLGRHVAGPHTYSHSSPPHQHAFCTLVS